MDLSRQGMWTSFPYFHYIPSYTKMAKSSAAFGGAGRFDVLAMDNGHEEEEEEEVPEEP